MDITQTINVNNIIEVIEECNQNSNEGRLYFLKQTTGICMYINVLHVVCCVALV